MAKFKTDASYRRIVHKTHPAEFSEKKFEVLREMVYDARDNELSKLERMTMTEKKKKEEGL